jgi:hypothetical protein
MGGNSSSNGGGEGPANKYQKPLPPKKKNPIVEFIKGGGITGRIIEGISEGIKTSKTNRQLLGTSDYQGGGKSRVNILAPDRDDFSNNNQVTQTTQVPKTILSPTTAEVSQSEAANAVNEEDPLYVRKKKTKAKGRSQTILTSSKGVTTDEGLTLGKPSLLGRA